MTQFEWHRTVNQTGVTTVIMRSRAGRIVGMGTVVVVRLPTRIKAYFEDAAVDPNYRRRGIATMIQMARVEIARESGAPYAYLTSSRPEAKALLNRLNWSEGETTPYFRKT